METDDKDVEEASKGEDLAKQAGDDPAIPADPAQPKPELVATAEPN
jgi:hypothetical protein